MSRLITSGFSYILNSVYWRFVIDNQKLRNFQMYNSIQSSSRCLWVWLYSLCHFGKVVNHISVGFLLFIWVIRQCEGLWLWSKQWEVCASFVYLCVHTRAFLLNIICIEMLNVVVVCIGAVFFSFCFRISLIRTYAATFNEICVICVICGLKQQQRPFRSDIIRTKNKEHAENNTHITFNADRLPFHVGRGSTRFQYRHCLCRYDC